ALGGINLLEGFGEGRFLAHPRRALKLMKHAELKRHRHSLLRLSRGHSTVDPGAMPVRKRCAAAAGRRASEGRQERSDGPTPAVAKSSLPCFILSLSRSV